MKLNQLNPLSSPKGEALQVSEICLGTMTFGRQDDAATSFEVMDAAFAGGINFFDVAEMYPAPTSADTQGNSERIVGDWLKARGRRGDVVIATKATGPGGADWIRGEGRRLDAENLRAAVDASLARLGIDHIDLYQMHWPDRKSLRFGAKYSNGAFDDGADVVPIADTLGALKELQDAGKIGLIGVSNENSYGLMKYIALADASELPRIATIQNAYNLLNRVFETVEAETCVREGVGLLAYAPVAAGFLTGKYVDGAQPAGTRYTLWPEQTRYRKVNCEPAIKSYLALAQELGMDGATLALAFCRQRAFVASTIAGARSAAQVEGIVASTEIELNDEALDRIDEIHARYPNPAP